MKVIINSLILLQLILLFPSFIWSKTNNLIEYSTIRTSDVVFVNSIINQDDNAFYFIELEDDNEDYDQDETEKDPANFLDSEQFFETLSRVEECLKSTSVLTSNVQLKWLLYRNIRR